MPHPSIYAQTYPRKPAFIMGNTGEMVTFGQLDERSCQGAQLFRSLGLKTGDHIGLMLENNARFMEIVWAAQRAGLIYTPISTHLKQEETAYILPVDSRRPLFLQVVCKCGHVVDEVCRLHSPGTPRYETRQTA